ncbi:MAG TPA: hypothetical protein V6C58_22735, partial [Allocoleopsis sp.]
TIFFLVQTWFSVPKEIRKLFNGIFCFRIAKEEINNMFEEVVECHKKYVNDISKIVFNEPFKYLVIFTDSQRMFDGFDEIVINDGIEANK